MTVDELLATAPAAVGTTDEMLVIDPDTRQINLPGVELVFGVESDAQAERKYFYCPRYVGNGLDLASCFIRVNYRNANGVVDAYLVDDMAVTGDGEAITFSWALHRNVTLYKGQVQFVVCCNRPGGNGVPAAEWNTTVSTGIVLAGLEPDSAAVEAATSDAITALLTMVDNVGVTEVADVRAEGDAQVQAVKTASETAEAAAVAEIEAKGVNVRASIPDDYTALSGAVRAIEKGMAPGIVCEVEGTAVAVSDASNQAMRGLRIFGKSTQNGVPTPDAPVEIVSVEKPVVTVAGKNLLPREYKNGISRTHGGLTYTVQGDGSIHVAGTVTSAESYFIITDFNFGENSVAMGQSNGVYVWSDCLYNKARHNTMLYFSQGNVVDKIYHPQVELGTVPTEWESPSGQIVSLTHTLPGIPVTSGGNYTDSDGQQWISDEVDLERGVYVQRCNVVEFDGTNHSFYTGQHTNGQLYVGISDFDIERNSRVISSHYKSAVWSNNNGEVYCSNDVVIVTDNRFASVSEAKRYFGETPVVFIYALEIPIETPLSETEIAAYRALHTNKPNTTILNDSGAHMAVAYTADTKLYIDNLLKE